MALTFAIADLHGRFDLLCAALERIEAHSPGGTVVFLGDYVDRGPQSCQIIERLMEGPPPGWEWKCLRGNHEDIMMTCCVDPRHIAGYWIPNGGGATLQSYGAVEGEPLIDAAKRVPLEHLAWMAELLRMHIDEHRVFVHAGVDRGRLLDMQDDKQLAWKIYDKYDVFGHGKRHVVHGHEQRPGGPVLHKGRTNLDTFAWKHGRLVIGVFDDDKPGGPVDLEEVIL